MIDRRDPCNKGGGTKLPYYLLPLHLSLDSAWRAATGGAMIDRHYVILAIWGGALNSLTIAPRLSLDSTWRAAIGAMC